MNAVLARVQARSGALPVPRPLPPSRVWPLLPRPPLHTYASPRAWQERMAPVAAAESRRPLVVMYGHSMCGAALQILTGGGKVVDGESFLGFDGKYIMPNATPVYLHK